MFLAKTEPFSRLLKQNLYPFPNQIGPKPYPVIGTYLQSALSIEGNTPGQLSLEKVQKGTAIKPNAVSGKLSQN